MSLNILPYQSSLAMYTDLYQLTMGYGYWKLGLDQNPASFALFFRKNPFDGGYAVCAGLELILASLENFNFMDEDIEYLKSLTGSDGKCLFSKDYLDYLSRIKLTLNIDAIPEGTTVFPHEPLVRITGSILQCQLLETLLLNFINFHSLIATKASRVCQAAGGDPVLEFGARRAQGIDGGLSASRAAYIGGCDATSNVMAGKLYHIPVKGTHAHSWVLCFDDELEAFEQYAACMPNNLILLIDTYNSLDGLRNAIQVANQLKEKGVKLAGVRLDSGDLAYLSIEARKILDEEGYKDAVIVGSNDLDEFIIKSLKEQGAKVSVWGVGTNLVTASGQSSIGGIYKMTAFKKDGQWIDKIKLSEQTIKINTPGILQVRRFMDDKGRPLGDGIFDESKPPENKNWTIIDPQDPLRFKKLTKVSSYQDLLIPVIREGKRVYQSPPIDEIRQQGMDQLTGFHKTIRRFDKPHFYPAGLEKSLHKRKSQLITNLRESSLRS